jgi:hypothetical protein
LVLGGFGSDLMIWVGANTGIRYRGGPVLVKEAVVERSREVSYIDFDGILRGLEGGLGIRERWVFVVEEEEGEAEEREGSESEEESWD